MVELADPSAVAVVVPSHGRPDRLADCLAALARQEGGPYPTVVVDDGSPEPLAPICAAHGWVTCIRQPNAGPAAARNAGAAAATEAGARFLCFTDDDCRPRPGWVRALLAAQGAAGAAGDGSPMVGGRVENALERNPYAAASQSLCDYLYDYFGAAEGQAPFFTSNNIGCSAEGFAALGGFDASFPLAAAEDRDFGQRWRGRVGPLVYAPDAVVDHAHALTLARFWRQHANYGRGARHLHKVMEVRADPRPRLERLAFYAGLVAHPLRRPGRARLGQAALLCLSQVAMVAGYLHQARAERR